MNGLILLFNGDLPPTLYDFIQCESIITSYENVSNRFNNALLNQRANSINETSGNMSMKTVFVTCGATVPFPQLIETVFSSEVAGELLDLGFKRIIVQFGNNYRESFLQRINVDDSPVPSQICLGFDGDPVHGFYESSSKKLEVIGFEYTTEIQELIKRNADLVISHAGTGSILDALKLNKPLIVCVNDTLMDNHQQQIADQFASQNYLWATHPKVDEIIRCLERSQTEKAKPFPTTYNKNFEKALLDLVYGASP